jgi:hypothetical protein
VSTTRRLATRRLGYTGEPALLSQTFSQLDADSSGVVGRAELHSWLTKREHRRSIASEVAFDDATRDNLEWSETGLRYALQLTAIKNGLVPLDLMRAYDKQKDGSLSAKVRTTPSTRGLLDQTGWCSTRGGACTRS